jgi:hypothetical protein
MKAILPLLGLAVVSTTCLGADYRLHTFEKVKLTDQFWCEGADTGDFNHDGKPDLAAGPFWWEGPEFKIRHEYRPATKTSKIKKADGTEATVAGYKGALGNENDYSDNFFTFVCDLNGDGWDDIIVVGLPGEPQFWYENPKGAKAADGSGHWTQHKAMDVLDNESPVFGELFGNRKPVMMGNANGFFGYFSPDYQQPAAMWKWHPVTPKGAWHKYTHGFGFGDVNGDGRADFMESNGWWEQPASLDGDPVWVNHKFPFAPGTGTAGGSQFFAYDFNADGLNDVLTTLNPHGYGLAWYEQVREGGQISFTEHIILNKEPADSKYGVKFSQMHAIALVDMDGDGVKDIVTGKRFWAHGPTGDVEPNAPAVLYWFRTVRGADKSVDFVPYLIDDDSGVGTQVVAADVNGDGLPDVLVGNKKGIFIFLHHTKSVSKAEWEATQPKAVQK